MLTPSLFRRSALFSLAAVVGAILPVAAQPGIAAGGPGTAAAKITAVKFLQLTGSPQKARFTLKIQGENLPASAAGTTIRLYTKDPGKPVENQAVTFVTSTEIDVSGEAPVGTVITTVNVIVGDKTTPSPEGMTISIKPLPPETELKEFGVKFDHQKSKDFPNLHSLIVTKESGDPGVGFAANHNHMSVEIEPAGITDLKVVQSNREQLELHFVAAADYEPKNVLITVFNGSDLDWRHPIGVAKSPPEDPELPQITKIETLFVSRSSGAGRLRIYGKKFGIQDTPEFPVDDYLCNCLQRANVNGHQACGDTGDDRKQARPSQEISSFCNSLSEKWNKYNAGLRGRLVVGVNSRNIGIRVEKVKVIDASDGMIDVYFEFTRYPGYAWPFRLAGVDLSITKPISKIVQTVKAESVAGEVEIATPTTFNLSSPIDGERDPSLTYQYTVLDKKAANGVLGQGVADNFFVVDLSVVNHGKKKVSVPLAAIQAEVEWLHGFTPLEAGPDFYIEGPATVAPIPLAAVSAYFGAYQKLKGLRTIVFNVLDGVTTLATALIPYSGPALKDAEIVLSGGLIPGLRQGWPDLLAQQLQNLTSLSWESSETLAAGESMSKYIYIQRKSQFGPKELIATPPRRTGKQISSIMGLEVTGFEVPDTPSKRATPAAADPAATQGQPAGAPAAKTPPGP
jgi:hypothetical protein